TSEEAYIYYSDWPTMLTNGWLDAAIPMNYKANSNNASLYNAYCDRCYSCWQFNRHIFIGLGAYLNPKSNSVTQLNYAFYGQAGGTGLPGAVTYSYGVPYAPTFDDGNSWWPYVMANVYTNTVSTPTMPWRNPATATEGILWGRVRDASSGNYIDDSIVTVTGGPNFRTDGNGYYVATRISATTNGTSYSVSTTKAGFVSQLQTGVKAFAADVARYDFMLNFPAPSSLGATPVSSSQIGLSWVNSATNASAIVIARGASSGGPYTDVVSLATNLTSYTNNGLAASTTYYYVVRATNSYGGTINSSQASATTLVAGVPPGITTQPQSQTVTQANSATFSVVATGTAPLAYQWRFYGTNLSGATNSSYTRTNAQPKDAGPYSVFVTNGFGTSNSVAASLAVIVIPPNITQNPVSRAAVPGGYADFQVSGMGSNLVVQWQANQLDLAGATNPLLVFTNIGVTNFASYRAIVTNGGGSVTSGVSQLTLALSPVIVSPIVNADKVELHFSTEFGPAYAGEFKTSLADPGWIEFARSNGTGVPAVLVDETPTNVSRFYRLRLY
ncbi:MAG TPA: immunoglobulin domain-containing protein, partial [Candidatus Dormibacteraeota bacterium]|nr:immunoglobulin domain-containing protein [Candidatus Dormibacteraeota bacterium]